MISKGKFRVNLNTLVSERLFSSKIFPFVLTSDLPLLFFDSIIVFTLSSFKVSLFFSRHFAALSNASWCLPVKSLFLTVVLMTVSSAYKIRLISLFSFSSKSFI